MLNVPAPGTQESPYPGHRYAWYVVIVLTATYTISFVDRQIMALMIGPIRHDLHISDFQISLLIGLAFGIFYTVLGIPIARLADRYSRRMIIAIGITLWCVMTAVCGLAHTYGQLFAARIGVGVGEAALSPSALSLISDYFPVSRRGRAITFYTMGISFGSGVAMIVGGALVALVTAAPRVSWPVVGELYAWQKVFLLVGLPGLLMVALMASVREPPRRERLITGSTADSVPGAPRAAAPSAGTPTATGPYLLARWRLYGSHFLGMSVVSILTYGFLAWTPAMFVRTWGWKIQSIGLAYGCITLVSAPLCVLLVAHLARRFERQGRTDVYMRAALWCALLGIAGAVLVPIMPTPLLAVAMLMPMSVGAIAGTGAGLAALMVVTPNQMRAQAAAAYYLVVNLLGLTVGPSGIAAFTDYVFKNDALLRYSVLCVSLIAGISAVGFLIYCLGQYRRAVEEARLWASAPVA